MTDEPKKRGRPKKVAPHHNPNGAPKKELVKARENKAAALAEALTSEALALEEERDYQELFEELSPRQKTIVRLKMRGMGSKEIAQSIGITSQAISYELRKIKDFFATKGRTIEQDYVIGEAGSLFTEIQQQAWKIYSEADKDLSTKLKALAVIRDTHEKHLKLLMDVGKLEVAAKKVEHVVEQPLFIAQLDSNPTARDKVIDTILSASLDKLEDPIAPILDSEIADAEIIEDDLVSND